MQGSWCLLSVILVVTLGAQGCATRSRAVSTPAPSPHRPGVVESGRASWYGRTHHGQLTASGEPFDMNALTAAHPTLPFGTRLRVVNLDNDRQVDVRINDRGPIVPGRILDLSYAAARALGAVGAGVIPVRFRVLPSE
jgi:rare lipoprotein A